MDYQFKVCGKMGNSISTQFLIARFEAVPLHSRKGAVQINTKLWDENPWLVRENYSKAMNGYPACLNPEQLQGITPFREPFIHRSLNGSVDPTGDEMFKLLSHVLENHQYMVLDEGDFKVQRRNTTVFVSTTVKLNEFFMIITMGNDYIEVVIKTTIEERFKHRFTVESHLDLLKGLYYSFCNLNQVIHEVVTPLGEINPISMSPICSLNAWAGIMRDIAFYCVPENDNPNSLFKILINTIARTLFPYENEDDTTKQLDAQKRWALRVYFHVVQTIYNDGSIGIQLGKKEIHIPKGCSFHYYSVVYRELREFVQTSLPMEWDRKVRILAWADEIFSHEL